MSHPCYHWWAVTFGAKAKTQLVPGYLYNALCADMTARGCPPAPIGPAEYPVARRVHSWGLDTSGPCYTDTPWRDYKIDNLVLSFPCDGIDLFLAQLRKTTPRYFSNDRGYVKLHSYYHALVLPLRHRALLLAKLEADLEAAELEARVFYAGKDKKISDIIPGAHPADRFFPADRGMA